MLNRLSFRARILAFFVGLLVLVQSAVFVAVYIVTERNARAVVLEELEAGARVFEELRSQRERELIRAARLVSGDFAFKSAFSIRHERTMASALNNLRTRTGASIAMLAGLDQTIIATTIGADEPGGTLRLAGMLREAEQNPDLTGSATAVIDGALYQLVAVPLMAPVPAAWIVLGFVLDDEFTNQFRALTGAHVSLIRNSQFGWVIHASTLPKSLRTELAARAADQGNEAIWSQGVTLEWEMEDRAYVALAGDVEGLPGTVAVLQRPLDEVLARFAKLRQILGGLTAAALALSILGAGWIARSVTRPVNDLVGGVRAASAGKYSQAVAVSGSGEIGELADAFNDMVRGLAERDRVQSLLGKVIAPQVAAELLAKDVELGGEERTVTVLFCDIRGFTPLSQSMEPKELVTLLNQYLTRMTGVIESNQGIVDKYIGDAIMALFGAPLVQSDDATRAVRSALGMSRELAQLNREFSSAGKPTLACGIGINTANVVAGNMGSERRMNYTVIGDGVNLASRVESLTRIYGVEAIVTSDTQAAAPGFLYRELDRVRVRGRDEPARIFEPMGEPGALPEETLERLDRWHGVLKKYRDRDWDGAAAGLSDLMSGEPASQLYRLYRDRIDHLRTSAPGPAWDGTFTHEQK